MRYGLCVGINDYPGTNMDLRGCVNDARDWAWLLKRLHPGIYLLSMVDGEATRKDILWRLSLYVEALNRGDTLYFTFSGHGTRVPDENGDEGDGRDEAICPHDVMTAGPILDDELNWIFAQRARGSRVVVIADSCFSGTVARAGCLGTLAAVSGPGGRVEFLVPYRRTRFLAPAVIPARVRGKREAWPSQRDEAYMTVSACLPNEVSYDAEIGGRPCGAFSHAATKTFPGATSYADWMRWMRKLLPSAEYPQTPNLTGGWCAKHTRALG